MSEKTHYSVWSKSVQKYCTNDYTKADCIELANAISEHINDKIVMCTNYPSTVEVTETGAKVLMAQHTRRYSNTVTEVNHAASDFADGYIAAQKAMMEKVAPHLKVSYKKAYPDAA